MRNFLLLASIFAVVLAAGAVFADEPAKTPAPAPAKADAGGAEAKADAMPCPVCVIIGEKGIKQDLLKAAGVSSGTVQQCKMMMGAEMSRDDAACLLAMKDKLKLTKEQVEKLETGLGAARQAAAELLTAKQRGGIWGEIPGQLMTLGEIHGRIHEALRQEIDAPGVAAPCPLCATMGSNGIDREKAKAAGMSAEMLMQTEMLLGTGVSREDAQCLLAMKEELELDPDQMGKLGQSIADSRKAASAVLTPEQQKILSELPEKAASVMAIHSKLHGTEAKPAPSKEEKPKDDEAAKPKEEKPKEDASAKPAEKK